MALLPSLHSIILPFIFIFSIPLAIFATITSTIAFSILGFRVLVVYAELAVAVIPHYLFRFGSRGPKRIPAQTISLGKPYSSSASLRNSPTSRRSKRRESNASAGSVASVGSMSDLPVALPVQESIGPQRDFEGVGGWHLGPPSEDDYLWTSMNSRLELPADHVRRHHRSLTSGSLPMDGRRSERSYSPEMRMGAMSPNTSRTRTPPIGGFGGGDSYFSAQGSPRAVKRALSVVTAASGSSGSSKGSGGPLSMTGSS